MLKLFEWPFVETTYRLCELSHLSLYPTDCRLSVVRLNNLGWDGEGRIFLFTLSLPPPPNNNLDLWHTFLLATLKKYLTIYNNSQLFFNYKIKTRNISFSFICDALLNNPHTMFGIESNYYQWGGYGDSTKHEKWTPFWRVIHWF